MVPKSRLFGRRRVNRIGNLLLRFHRSIPMLRILSFIAVAVAFIIAIRDDLKIWPDKDGSLDKDKLNVKGTEIFFTLVGNGTRLLIYT